jgi:phospholipid transport system substrate-binding protein
MTLSSTMTHTTRRRTLLGLLALPLTGIAGGFASTMADPEVAAADPAPVANPEAARKVIEKMVNDALALLRDPALKSANKRDERRQRLRAVADVAFDWEALARSSLGHYWRNLQPEHKTDFVTVFKDLLANQYMDDIDRFQGNEAINILSAKAHGPLVEVKTTLTTGSAEKVPMNYTLHCVNCPPKTGAEADTTWQIEDLSIEGVSMVKHYRTSFKRFLVNKSFADLLAVLKRKLGAS